MSIHAPGKYRPFEPIPMPRRQWPGNTITTAPVWCSVDLRDGNQALQTPMSVAAKMRMWEMLVAIGFREIEVGFPAASDTEAAFIRALIEQSRIPEQVTIQVLSTCRQEHIRRTFQVLKGAPRAVVHIYNPTSTLQREVVFGTDRDGVKGIAVRGARWVAECAAEQPDTAWVYEYSPESFTGTEIDYAVEVVDAVMNVWQPTPRRKAIVNLPATVEMATPNVYADQIEYFCQAVGRREGLIVSVHPHNDRGTAVAAAELAMMAGAERVEGTLFGNGERTGNVDLVTLALNMHTQGMDCGLDFSNMAEVVAGFEACTGMAVGPRQPYAGELVFTAFSGSHQDAIRKGLAHVRAGGAWRVPYVPIDPADLGGGCDRLVRINSQSGKGGAAHVLETFCDLRLPRGLEVAFGRHIKAESDADGGELSAGRVWELFTRKYVRVAPFQLVEVHGASGDADSGVTRLTGVMARAGESHPVTGSGNGPVSALVDAMADRFGIRAEVLDYTEQALGPGAGAQACAVVQLSVDGGPVVYGVGLHGSVLTASLNAVVSAVNRGVG
ncbi:MAG: 2-isopropylmalate synthase [Nitrospirota bacterium]|nr:2-isopropylmalate synthase [Nitrospirota bacterium]